MTVADEVALELREMQKIGIPVTAEQLAYPHLHAAEMEEYRSGLKINEIADFVRDLVAMDAPREPSNE